MAVGKLFLELGHVSYTDVFSYTSTKPIWVDHEWGSGVIFYMLADIFGQKGLLLLQILLHFGTLFFVHLTIRERIRRPSSVLFNVFLAYALLPGFWVTVRSQTFTYFFFSFWMYLLERSRRGENKGLLLLPVTTIIWANLHGGFISGFGLLLIYGIGGFLNRRSWQKYFLILLSCVPLTLLNPYGGIYWTYLYEAMNMPRPLIVEWWPLDFLGPINAWFGFKLFFLSTLFFVIIHLIKNIKVDWVDIVLISITGFLPLRHVRHTPFFIIASAPFLYSSYRNLSGVLLIRTTLTGNINLSGQRERILNIVNGSLHGVLLGVVILLACSLPFRVDVPQALFPVKGMQFIKMNRINGNLLVHFNWGSYAIWELYPQCRVSMDGRYEEVYDNETYLEINRFFGGLGGWKEMIEKYKPDLVLVPKNSSIDRKLKNEKQWVPVYQDDQCELFLPHGHAQKTWFLPDENKEIPDPFSTDGQKRYIER
jgi:hypothetical protein